MKKHYPWHAEVFLENNIDAQSGSAILYDVTRNPFAHALGLDTKIIGGPRASKRVVRRSRGRELRIGVGRLVSQEDGSGLSESFLLELEAPQRPLWLSPTIDREESGYTLSIEALYRGVRLLIEAMTHDPAAMAHAARFLAHSE